MELLIELKKCPNLLLKFSVFLIKKYSKVDFDWENGEIWVEEDIKQKYHYKLSYYEFVELLTEFMDGQEFYLGIAKMSKNGWMYVITTGDIMLEIKTDFSSRQVAFEFGICKCFELKEKQLEDK